MQQLEGYLYKRGDVVKKWNLRYFILYTAAEPFVVYYRKVGEAPANTLKLISANVTVSSTVKEGTLFPFTVEASGDKYELAATTQQDRRRWVDQLTQASARDSPGAGPLIVTEANASGHLLAPSPLGLRRSSDYAELQLLGSPPSSPSAQRHTTGQEAFGSPSKLRRVALDFSSPQQSPQGAPRNGSPGLPRRSSTPSAAASRSPLPGSGAAAANGSESPGWGQSLRSPSGQHKRSSLLAAISSSIRNVIVPPIPSDIASSMSDDSHESGMTAFSVYTANLRPLRGTGTPTAALSKPALGACLAADSLLEQFDRAQQYVARHKEDFSAERLESLQCWVGAAKGGQRGNDGTLAAAAMYVVQVTQANGLWASEHDTAFISPDAMMRDVQRCPSVRCLMDLKDCLDFCSTSWVSLFCQLSGADLLLQALDAHAEAAEGGGAGEAREALLASLQCVHALMSGAAGMRGVLGVDGCMPRVCSLLALAHTDAAKLVVEMLIKLCLFSAEGYRLAIKGLLGERVTGASGSSVEAAGSAAAAAAAAPKRAPPSVAPPLPPPPPPPWHPAKAAAKAAPPAPPPPPPSLKRPSRPDQAPGGKAPGPVPTAPEKPQLASEAASLQLEQKEAAQIILGQVQPLQEPCTDAAKAASGLTVSREVSDEWERVLPQQCSSLIALLKVDTAGRGADFELCDHIISFMNAALTSPEAQANLSLRKRFTSALLDNGLLNVLADIYSLLDPYMNASIDMLRANVKDVIAAPKPAAVPPPPAKRAAPPPPPPKGPLKGKATAAPPKARVEAGPQPGRRMKSFFWDKLPDSRVDGTFWAAHPPAYSSLNIPEVEELFQAVQLQKARLKQSAVKQLAVLELKRATAIGIRMAGLKLHWSKAADAVMRLDPELLASAEDAATVLACVPSAEERSMLEAYLRSSGRAETLSDAERFCLDLMQVPRIHERLRTFAASFEAGAQLREAAAVLAAHLAAHAELAGSGCFRAALMAALALGNFLNHGSRLGQAAGFRLKNLPKLQDTRSRDGRTTLLRYMAAQLCAEEPPHALLSDEAPHVVSPALQTSLLEVAEVLEKVSMAAADMARETERTPPSARLCLHVRDGRVSVQLLPDSYHDTMTASLQEVRVRLEEAKGTLEQARASFSKLVAYFGENSAALASDGDFWHDVTVFVRAFSSAQRETLQQRQEKDRRQAREQKQAERQPPTKSTGPVSVAPDAEPCKPLPASPNGPSEVKEVGKLDRQALANGAPVQDVLPTAGSCSLGPPDCDSEQNAAKRVLSDGIKSAAGEIASKFGIEVHATTCMHRKSSPGRAQESEGSIEGSGSLLDSAGDLEQLLGSWSAELKACRGLATLTPWQHNN